jgi:hypothetical protein
MRGPPVACGAVTFCRRVALTTLSVIVSSSTGGPPVRHLTTSLRFGSKAASTAVAATLVVGGVAVAQTGSVAPDDEAVVDTDEDADEDADEPLESPSDDDGEADAGEPEDGGTDDGDTDDGDTDDGEPDDGDVDDDDAADPDAADPDVSDDGDGDGDGDEVPAADEPDGGVEGRGSATSERVHEALTLDGELRPGDEGWGAAVSESARSGGHGERVSRAARGLDAPAPAPAPAAPPADAAASAPRADGPGEAVRATAGRRRARVGGRAAAAADPASSARHEARPRPVRAGLERSPATRADAETVTLRGGEDTHCA